MPEGAPSRRSALLALLIAAVLCGGFQLAFGAHNINLRDEGYLWYGVVRSLAGEVPLRDFQAYDPGRYYWCAAFEPLFGAGLVGVRASVAVFAALGMAAGLLVARRVLRHDAWMLPVGVLLLLWQFPRHKLFEPAITEIAMLAVVRLIERPGVRRHLEFGVVVGAAAFLGRNHGLYLVVVALAVCGLLAWRADPRPGTRGLLAGCVGIALGALPLAGMLLLVPGFAGAYLDALTSVLERGANIPMGYRWPWGAHPEPLARRLALDAAYMLPPLALPAGGLLGLRRLARGESLARLAPLLGSVLVGLVYVHHYAIRSDLPHLAQAYPPVLFASLALAALSGIRRTLLGLVLGGLTVVALWVAFEGHTELKDRSPDVEARRRFPVEIRGEKLVLPAPHAALVTSVARAIARHVGPDEPLFIAPTMPMWYPLLGKRSPTWWIYFLWPATEEEQAETIERLQAGDVQWALIIQRPFNDDPTYGFKRTNPLVWGHITADWDRVRDSLLPPGYLLYRRR